MASDLDVSDPILPWQHKRPRRCEESTQEEHFPGSVEDFYQPIYFEALDLACNGIQKRFDHPGYEVYSKLESLLVKAANSEGYEKELKFIVDFYKEDFNPEQLKLQLNILSCNLPPISSSHNLASILQHLKQLSASQRELMSEVVTLASLILLMPATNTVSECSFSSLGWIISHLRATMTQVRLNSVMILHVRNSRTDDLCVTDVANEFVRGSQHRETIFGKFLPTD